MLAVDGGAVEDIGHEQGFCEYANTLSFSWVKFRGMSESPVDVILAQDLLTVRRGKFSLVRLYYYSYGLKAPLETAVSVNPCMHVAHL